MIRIALLCLALTACHKVEYIKEPVPEYLNQGCQVPKPESHETIEDEILWRFELIATICECDSRMDRATGKNSDSDFHARMCGYNQAD